MQKSIKKSNDYVVCNSQFKEFRSPCYVGFNSFDGNSQFLSNLFILLIFKSLFQKYLLAFVR